MTHDHLDHLSGSADQPLIGIPADGDRVDYFTDDEDVTAASSRPPANPAAMIGAWSDLDWNAAVDALDRIRHESPPTPPLSEI